MATNDTLPWQFRIGLAASLIFAVAVGVVAAIFIPTDSGTARLFVALGGLLVGGAISGIAGAVIGIAAKPPRS